MLKHISLSDVVFSRVFVLPRFGFWFANRPSDLWLCVPRGFDPRCDLARPGPAKSGPRAPDAPHPLPMRAPSSSSPSLIWISRATTSLSLSHLSLPVVP
jgi:hypothetical protein